MSRSTDSPPEGGEPPEDEVARLRVELAEAKAVAARATSVRLRRTRQFLTALLVVLTTLSVLGSTVAFWAHRTVFDEDHYLALVGPLAVEETVVTALSTWLTGEITTALDLRKRISDALDAIPEIPRQAQFLADPIADAANDLIHKEVTKFLHSPEFRNLWNQVNTVGHQKVVALLRGDYKNLKNVTVGDEEVRLNLIPIITKVLHQLVQRGVARIAPDVTVPQFSPSDIPEEARAKLGSALGVSLPPDFGEVTIMAREELDELQRSVGRFDRLVWMLFAMSVVFALATVAVAVNRRKAIVALAVGVAAGLFLGGVVVRKLEEAILDRIDNMDAHAAAETVIGAAFDTMREVGVTIFTVAVVTAVLGHLLGRPRWLMAILGWVRRFLRETDFVKLVGEHPDGLRIGGVGVALFALFVTGIGFLPLVVLGGLLAVWLWAVDAASRKLAARPLDIPPEESARAK